MAVNKLFFSLHVYEPSLPHFHFKILLCFLHADAASRANQGRQTNNLLAAILEYGVFINTISFD